MSDGGIWIVSNKPHMIEDIGHRKRLFELGHELMEDPSGLILLALIGLINLALIAPYLLKFF